ncbi:phosphotransferase family protein [Streptomyces luteogriseus]|uniref:Aminoglycoside phosphotransferase (APT) family kinase protein n=1 Tax=Streptomyces luteogriseus TaxID=68233 RepID=A0A7W7GHI2_9ACTN|nr:aminoglycoside phosphotransferase family protein [Streptomyces luteogriseus]MBB4711035.1 aminoglycoside phosphotransferase (APT) family kinase protein [Streptomyces luteogriseus]
MTFTEELRGLLPLRPAPLLTRPVDALAARRLTASLGADGDPHRPRRTFSDLLVFRLDDGATQAAVVKHARSARATASLAHECEAVRQLARDERLGAWRRLLPVVEERRLDGPLPLLVESCLPGVEADVLLRRSPELARRVTRSALETIRELHRATGRTQEATGRVAEWVKPRLAVLAEEVGWCRHGEGARALVALRERVERDLAGRHLLVGWTHGDYHPGNVLLSEHRGDLSGVIDWAGAVPDGPSLLDCHTFVLTMRHQLAGREFGGVVADVVRRASLLPGDRRLLADVRALPSGRRAETAVTLLTWLWHVAGNLEKSARYARSHRWVADNVVAVLGEVLAREGEEPAREAAQSARSRGRRS